MRLLLVKMSSLGDVVHTLPAVTDALAAQRGLSIDWVVEEAFAPVPARHPGVQRIIPIGWRRWRSQLVSSRRQLGRFYSTLRAERYDLVLDAQGLLKSAAVAGLARAPLKAGFDRRSAREGAAALFYRRRVAVARDRHAVDRLRALFAAVLDYPLPETPADFGIAPTGAAGRGCLLLHGTTWASKHWPTRFWQELAGYAAAAGLDVQVPWGDDHERERAELIAASGGRVLDRLGLGRLIDALGRAALVVGVDSGLAHLAAALNVPTLVIYGSTSAGLTGCRGRRVRNLSADFACAPCLARECSYRGPAPVRGGQPVVPACYASVDPEVVWQAARQLLAADDHADRLLHL